MQAHWKVLQWMSIVALSAVIASVMMGNYVMTYGALISTFIVFTSYLIAVGRFRGRSDEGDRGRGHA